MAAKQGLSAQLSQASEDAKRAVLQRTSLHNSLWFSNLNTTCTIKSAPPRSPDVLGLLAVKSGWLFKRNEQHVWQARYCCVVPHTFLYYFDGHPTQPCQSTQLTAKQQEELNKAVRLGYGKRGQSQPRSSLYHVLGGTNTTAASSHSASNSHIPQLPDDSTDANQAANSNSGSNNVQPAGIIDLECYTTIHRNPQNELLMELAGDETVNPDLRSFYFCANTEQEGEEWTQAFLAERHSALTDEREAYKQVCDGFAQQLQVLHAELDQARQQADTQQEELYRVRSQMEDTRRTCLRIVQEILERERGGFVPARNAYRTDLETIQAQDLGILPAVQLLCDYTRVLEETCNDTGEKTQVLEEQLQSKQQIDTTRVKDLEAENARLKAEVKKQQLSSQTQVETLTRKLLQAQKELQDVQKNLASQRMEMTMYQSSTRTKMGEIQSHKKILKKEVIDLRKKLEEANSELDLYRHRESSVKLEAEQERRKTKLLERYVEKIESQVKVQQNMMEMMSQAGSVYGGGSVMGGSQFGSPPVPSAVVGRPSTDHELRSSASTNLNPPPRQTEYNQVIQPNRNQHDDNDHEDDEDDDEGVAPNAQETDPCSDRRAVDDVDNKSHMSELTEDRTQKQFDAAMLVYSSNPQLRAAMQGSPRSFPPHMSPPAIIGIAEESSDDQLGNGAGEKLETIRSQSGRPPKAYVSDQSPTRRSGTGERSIDRILNETGSVGSKSRMSIAQKARMEADQHTTPVKIRMNQTPLRGNNAAGRNDGVGRNDTDSRSSKGFFASIGRRLEEAIDNSVLGVDMSDTEGSEYATTDVQTDNEHEDEKKSGDTASEASTNVSLSLAQRQALQRAQQMKFLKEQGLLIDENDARSATCQKTKPLSRREKLAKANRSLS